VKQPKAQKKLAPIIRDDDTRELIDGCAGKSLAALRDEAIIRLYHSTGARLSEVANLDLDDLDQKTNTVLYHGKGGKDRRVRYPDRTARAISRYLRARTKHKHADLPNLWLAERGRRPLQANGIKTRHQAPGRPRRARPRPCTPLAPQLRARIQGQNVAGRRKSSPSGCSRRAPSTTETLDRGSQRRPSGSSPSDGGGRPARPQRGR